VTINNYSENDISDFDKMDCEYSIRGFEVGKTGTPHIQGYVYFKDAKSLEKVKKMLPRAHLEKSKGTAIQNYVYCNKDGDFVEKGTRPEQGKRKAFDLVKETILETNSMASVLEVADSYQSAKFGELMLKYKEPARPYGPRKVYWLWGDTGTGKTFGVFEKHPEVFCPASFKWWDGYDGHKVVLLDDIRGDFCKYHEMLMLTGERPFRVEHKGGSRQAVYDTLYITSCCHPSDLWQTCEDKSQLLDRLTEIIHYEGESRRR